MSEQWQFTQDEQHKWHWTRVDAREQPIESSPAFETHTGCMLDAVRLAVKRRRAQAPFESSDGSGFQH